MKTTTFLLGFKTYKLFEFNNDQVRKFRNPEILYFKSQLFVLIVLLFY